MVLVFGMDFPMFEFLLVLNIIMLVYIVISMFEIRSLIQLRRDLEEFMGKPKKNKEYMFSRSEINKEEAKQPEIKS